MTITLYGIPRCDTVRKARAWLFEWADASIGVGFDATVWAAR